MSHLLLVVYSVAAVVGVGLASRSARTAAGRGPWWLLTAGAGVLVATHLLVLWAGPGPTGAPVDAARLDDLAVPLTVGLVAYPCFFAGLLLLLRQRVPGMMPTAWVDGLVVSVFLLADLCALAAQPGRPLPELGDLAAVAVAARPAFDLVMAAFALAVWALSGWRKDPQLPLVVAGFWLLTAADVVGVLRLADLLAVPGAGVAADAGRVGALVLLAVAAGRPTTAPVSRPQNPFVLDLVTPCLVLMGGLVLLSLDRTGVVSIGTASFVFCLLGVLGVGVKFLVVVVEIQQLTDQRRLARTDDLTGLTNRRGLHHVMARVLDGSAPVTLLLLDLNAFKDVNDRHGHQCGDELLTVVSGRITEFVTQLTRDEPSGAWRAGPARPGGGTTRHAAPPPLVARLGGDEFAVLLPRTGETEAVGLAEQLAARIAGPVDVQGHRLQVSTSVGVATAYEPGRRRRDARPGDGSGVEPVADAEELLRRADTAMYRAKGTGTAVGVFDATLDEHSRARALLLEEMRDELRQDLRTEGVGPSPAGIVAHFQPQVDPRTGTVSGVEALVRWQHPRLGLLAPVAFLDVAEQHGLMPAVTRRVLEQAVAQAALWGAQGRRLRMSVNLSVSSLADPGLPDLVGDVLARWDVPPSTLTLELTETGVMSDPVQALAVLRELSARGVGISIDDYGTGYSSLSYLKDLPATELKIDRSFTSSLLTDHRTAAIVAATVQMAGHLGLRTVAEGVEDPTTNARLAEMGCTETQGYLHARPMPAHELQAWMQERDGVRPGAPLEGRGVLPV